MEATVRISDRVLHRADEMRLGSNIEAYENTIPWMLSDRLRNPKFSLPEDPQTGIAWGWEPLGGRTKAMNTVFCKVVPGMSLSGAESQVVCDRTEGGGGGVVQTRVTVWAGERLEVEFWARTRDTPTDVTVTLRPCSGTEPAYGSATLAVDTPYWARYSAVFDPIPHDDDTAWLCLAIGGDSYVWFDQVHLRPVGEGVVAQALLDRFDSLVCPTLRFPGGCVSCNYIWQHGVGPVHRRPIQDDPIFKHKVYYDFGSDEYLALCRDKGIRPFITLNVSSATPEDCAGWAAYCRHWWQEQGLEPPPAYFMFGNENYGNWEIGHMTGPMYAKLLAAFVPGVRAAYPEARVMAIGEVESQGVRADQASPWLETVVTAAAAHFDILAVTRYQRCAYGGDCDARLRAVAEGVRKNRDSLQPLFEALDRHGLDRKVAVVEWNYWADTSHADNQNFREANDIRHCLFAAGMFNLYARLADRIEVANHYSLLVTMGALHIRNGRLEETDLLQVFDLYGPAFPGEVFEVSVEAPLYSERQAAVDALALRADGRAYVFLVNFHAGEAATVRLSGLPGTIREGVVLSATGLNTPLSRADLSVEADAVLLPPMSLARLTLEATP